MKIYIPVWIDQKLTVKKTSKIVHEIYIPVWIDQKQAETKLENKEKYNLHSSMDRLETLFYMIKLFSAFRFTFQYGQIRNASIILLNNS